MTMMVVRALLVLEAGAVVVGAVVAEAVEGDAVQQGMGFQLLNMRTEAMNRMRVFLVVGVVGEGVVSVVVAGVVLATMVLWMTTNNMMQATIVPPRVVVAGEDITTTTPLWRTTNNMMEATIVVLQVKADVVGVATATMVL